MPRNIPKAVYLKDYTPPAYRVDTVELYFELDAVETRVKSTLTIHRDPDINCAEFVLDGVGLELLSVAVDGVALKQSEYELSETHLSLSNLPRSCELSIENLVKPQGNTELLGLYQTGENLCTHCEPDGFRRITFFPDRPDIMARYTTTLVADAALYPILLANGNPIRHEQLVDNRHSVTWQDPFPKPSYLFALVAGSFARISDSYTTASGRDIALNLYADASVIDECHYALQSLKQGMAWDQKRYGREYDLDVYNIAAVTDHNFGAMENKGLNIYNHASIVAAGSAPATDDDYKLIRINVAHEYLHNWSGNRVSCRDWFQLALKEGFTTYRHCQYEEETFGAAPSRIGQVRNLRSKQFSEDASLNAHPVQPESYIEVSNFYTLTVYNKGCELVRMLHTLLGDEVYYRACEFFFAANDGRAVTIEEFVVAMEQVSGRDLKQFRRWYHQVGTPILDVSGEYDASNRSYTLTVVQNNNSNNDEPLHIPLEVGLLNSGGEDMPLQLKKGTSVLMGNHVLELRKTREVFRFINVNERPLPSLLRNFSAPVRLNTDLGEEDLIFLLRFDSNHFNRWEAMQQLVARTLEATIKARQGAEEPSLNPRFVEAVGELLKDKTLDKAVLAELLTMPLERDLSEMVTPIDVESISATRDMLRTELAKAHRKVLLQLYRDNSSDSPYQPDVEGMARRRLRNECLGLLMACENDLEVVGLCYEQAVNGDNMTDVIAALTLINNLDCPQRQQALNAYFERWKENPLAIDKWFQVQAQTRMTNALQQVQALMGHPAFDMTRPDRIRALFAWFFGLNFRSFHQTDGSTYHFFTDILLTVDQMNPTAVAWLYRKSDFVRWQLFDEPRQLLMKEQMKRILEQQNISKGLYELVSKCLEVPETGELSQ